MAGDSSAVYSNQDLDTNSSPYNQLKFIIENTVKGMLNTAIPVIVDSCTAPGPTGGAGYVSCTPLVMQRGSDGNALPQVSLPKLPFYRTQCGTAAIVMDPKPGDIGLAIFAQQDSSKVQEGTSQPSTPGSYRTFSMSDGFYLGGFVNAAPETFIHLNDEKREITITGPDKVVVNTKMVEVNASDKIALNTPLVELSGRLVQTGADAGSGSGAEFKNGLTNTGGSITSNGIVLESHVHTGVESGSSTTGGPQ